MSFPERPFQVGDVVYAEGASAILGDVVDVGRVDDDETQEVTVAWRATETVETAGLDEGPELVLSSPASWSILRLPLTPENARRLYELLGSRPAVEEWSSQVYDELRRIMASVRS